MDIDTAIRRMEMDNDLSILIQSALQVGLYYYDHHKYTEKEASLIFFNTIKNRYSLFDHNEKFDRMSKSVIGIEHISSKEMRYNARSIMYGVYINDKDNLLINKKLLNYLLSSSFFCEHKDDIEKIKSYADNKYNILYVSIPIKHLKSMSKFFNFAEETSLNKNTNH